MKLIDHATATEDLEFTEGNPGTGTAATRITAQWLNVLQAELAAIVEEAGITLDQTGVDRTQVLQALQTLFEGTDFASDAEYLAGSLTNKAVTPANLASNQSMSGNGYKKLPGGFIVQWGTATIQSETAAVLVPITFPVAFTTNARVVLGETFVAPRVDNSNVAQKHTQSVTGFTAYNQWTGNGTDLGFTLDWIAVGY